MPDYIPSLRVFISSPGDVKAERNTVHEVIQRLSQRHTYRNSVTFDVIAWDKPGTGVSMRANMTPQEAINRGLRTPAQCDIVVVICWSRLGTPFYDEDGKAYLSGTHWELVNALSNDETQVLLYRRTGEALFKADDTEGQEQQKRLTEFFKSDLFFDEEGHILRGINQYEAVEDFCNRFELDFEEVVRDILDRIHQKENEINTEAFLPLPAMPSLIIGRDKEIADLKNRIGLNDQSKQRFTVMDGLPGVGKTTVMSALANDPDLRTRFPDGILWTSLGKEPQLAITLRLWARVLGKSFDAQVQIDQIRSELNHLLTGKTVLIVIDDIWETNHGQMLNIGGASTATLCTTRFKKVANEISQQPNEIYTLNTLDETHSFALMQHLAPRTAEKFPQEMKTLANELEGLPLALTVAARLLESETNSGLDATDVFHRIREKHGLMQGVSPDFDPKTGTTPTIKELLDLSTDLLGETELMCFAMLGEAAPKPATFRRNEFKLFWGVEDPNPIIRKLINLGLLEYLPDQDAYWLHSILVMHAQSLIEDDD